MLKRKLDMLQNTTKNSLDLSDIDVFEGMVSVRSVFEGKDKGVTDREIKTVLFSEDSVKGNGKLLGFLKARSFVYGYELCVVKKEELELYATGNSHGGVVMLCGKRSYPDKVVAPKENGFYVILEGVEDPYNLGYAIRSVYAAGADGVIVPRHNAMMSAGIVCRSSAGASELIDIICGSDTEITASLKTKGYRLVCSDMNAPAPAHLSDLKKPIILAVGGERRGFSKALTSQADCTVRLDYGRDFPMALSAASAAAILAFEVTKQNKISN